MKKREPESLGELIIKSLERLNPINVSKKSRYVVLRALIIAALSFSIVFLLSACETTPGSGNVIGERVYTEDQKRYSLEETLTVEDAFKILEKKLDIPLLKPTYLPKGYYVSAEFDVHENRGENPRIVNAEHAELELEKAGNDPNSEYGHKWIRLSFGTSLDMANLTTSGVFVNNKPALMVGDLKWSLVSWVENWRGRKIRYAVEGSGISNKKLLKIAKSMRPPGK